MNWIHGRMKRQQYPGLGDVEQSFQSFTKQRAVKLREDAGTGSVSNSLRMRMLSDYVLYWKVEISATLIFSLSK